MGIIQRFSDIMSANINALLDKMEDPSKMIDQYLRNLESDLGKVKAETASVMAEETRSKRALDDCDKEIAKMQTYAEKAIMAGNDADARKFLEKKSQLTETRANLAQTYAAAADNASIIIAGLAHLSSVIFQKSANPAIFSVLPISRPRKTRRPALKRPSRLSF